MCQIWKPVAELSEPRDRLKKQLRNCSQGTLFHSSPSASTRLSCSAPFSSYWLCPLIFALPIFLHQFNLPSSILAICSSHCWHSQLDRIMAMPPLCYYLHCSCAPLLLLLLLWHVALTLHKCSFRFGAFCFGIDVLPRTGGVTLWYLSLFIARQFWQ